MRLDFVCLSRLCRNTHPWLSWIEHQTTNLGVGRSNRSGCAILLPSYLKIFISQTYPNPALKPHRDRADCDLARLNSDSLGAGHATHSILMLGGFYDACTLMQDAAPPAF